MLLCLILHRFVGNPSSLPPLRCLPTPLEPISDNVLPMNKRTTQRNPFNLSCPLPLNFYALNQLQAFRFPLLKDSLPERLNSVVTSMWKTLSLTSHDTELPKLDLPSLRLEMEFSLVPVACEKTPSLNKITRFGANTGKCSLRKKMDVPIIGYHFEPRSYPS